MSRVRAPNSTKRAAMHLIGMLLLTSAVAGCESSSGGAPGFDSLAAAPTPAASSVQAPPGVADEIDARFQGLAENEPTNASSYQIGPMDVLAISVFQVPELNTDAQVAENGTVTLPLIGMVKVSGKQAQQVGNDIAARLRAKYLQSPQVTVFVKNYNSQKVIVSGSVASPGAIAMTGETTLVSAIADARGFTDMADTSDVMVFRKINGRKYAARFNVSDIQSGKAADPHLIKGDLVYVDSSTMKTWMKMLLPLVPAAGLFVALV